MIAWMLYAVALGALFSVAALAGERALRLLRRPVRFVWLAAVLASAGVPLLALLLRPAGAPTASVAPLVVWGEATRPLQASAELLGRVSAATVSLERLVVLVWLLTTTVLLAALAWSWHRLRRQGGRWSARVIDGHSVLVSADVGPAVTDPLAGTIVLPAWLAAGPAEECRLALAHELEHRRAGDARLLWLTLLVAAVFPWNPSIWWHVMRLRRAIELDCDGRVLAAGASHKAYAELLLRVGERAGRMSPLSPALTEPRSLLRGRIDAMIERTVRFRLLRALAYGAAALLVVVAACEAPAPPDAVETADPAYATVTGDVYAESVVDDVPERVSCPPIEYPRLLQEAGIQGQVLLQFVVERDGAVGEPTIEVVSSSHQAFAAAAQQMIARCRFRPGVVRGESVRTLVHMPVQFALAGSASPARGDSVAIRITTSVPPGQPSPAMLLRDSAGPLGSPPLYVVDGVIVANPGTLDLNALDIETIEVVKGAAAIGMYGARARNGVVRITTKRD